MHLEDKLKEIYLKSKVRWHHTLQKEMSMASLHQTQLLNNYL